MLGCASVHGQTNAIGTANETAAPVNEKELGKLNKRLTRKNVKKNPYFPPSKRDYAAIALDDADLIRYAEFLKTPNTGLIRLHDAANCASSKNVLNVEDACPSGFILGKATAFSFRARKYRTVNFSDLMLHKNALHAVGLNSQGIIVALGDVALENLSASSDGIKALTEFVPSPIPAQAVQQGERFFKGIRVGKYVYRKSLPIKQNQTYALRAIAYKSKVWQQRGAFKVDILSDDKRDDVLTVFRVVGVNEDNSVNVLWREIERKPAPKIILESETEKKK